MKIFKTLFLTALALLVILNAGAQTADNYTLTVCGDGSSLQEATNNALQNAVGQAYGVYVSSDTTILNDNIVKDEIGTLSSGNILSYEVLSHTVTPQGLHMVTIKTTVSVTNLISFSQAKGSKVEFAGALFGANMRLIESAKKNERIVIDHFIKQVELFLDNCGPFKTSKILESSPKKNSDGTYYIDLKCRDVQTDVPAQLFTMVYNFLESITLTNAEREMYRQMDEKYHTVGCLMRKNYGSAGYGSNAFVVRTDRIRRLMDLLDSTKDIATIIAKDADGKVVATHKSTYRRAYGGRNVEADWIAHQPCFLFPYFWKKGEDGKLITAKFYVDDTYGYHTNFSPPRGNGTSGLTTEQVSRIASIEREYRLVYQKAK